MTELALIAIVVTSLLFLVFFVLIGLFLFAEFRRSRLKREHRYFIAAYELGEIGNLVIHNPNDTRRSATLWLLPIHAEGEVPESQLIDLEASNISMATRKTNAS